MREKFLHSLFVTVDSTEWKEPDPGTCAGARRTTNMLHPTHSWTLSYGFAPALYTQHSVHGYCRYCSVTIIRNCCCPRGALLSSALLSSPHISTFVSSGELGPEASSRLANEAIRWSILSS